MLYLQVFLLFQWSGSIFEILELFGLWKFGSTFLWNRLGRGLFLWGGSQFLLLKLFYLCFLSPVMSILVIGISLGIYLFYHRYWLLKISMKKCYKPGGLKTMETYYLTVWRLGIWNKLSARPRSLWNLQGILPCFFLASGVAGNLWHSLACGCITPISACFHMASSLCVCVPKFPSSYQNTSQIRAHSCQGVTVSWGEPQLDQLHWQLRFQIRSRSETLEVRTSTYFFRTGDRHNLICNLSVFKFICRDVCKLVLWL